MGKRKTIVIVAEGARDRHGNKVTSGMVKDVLADKNGLALDTRITTLGHVQRGGTAVAYDRMLGTLQGVEAVKAVLEATPETETCFIAITENSITRRPLMQAVQDTKEVAKAVDAQDFVRAMQLRDTEFAEMYYSYMMTTNVRVDDNLKPPKEVRDVSGALPGALRPWLIARADCWLVIEDEDWLHQRRRAGWRDERGRSSWRGLLHFQGTRAGGHP